MSNSFKVEVTGQETLDKATRLLAGIEGGLDRAVRSAMARSVSHLRSNTAKAVQERYAISANHIRDNENAKVRYSYQDGVQATVTYMGFKIPLYRYDGAAPKQPTQDTGQWVSLMIENQWRKIHPSVPAYGHQFRSTSPELLEDAFVAQMKSGHTGIFKRTGGQTSDDNDAIREIMGKSVPEMLDSDDVKHSLADRAMEKFDERLEHEVLAILNGWR